MLRGRDTMKNKKNLIHVLSGLFMIWQEDIVIEQIILRKITELNFWKILKEAFRILKFLKKLILKQLL